VVGGASAGASASIGLGACGLFFGILMLQPQFRQRTVRPRASVGTPSTDRHRRLGHIILIVPFAKASSLPELDLL